ncbi:MAG: metal ABC transporter ATP-binding protein [Coriobacteriales bacterium]|jgi:zinc transport system ATP-binding protein|nr:metal ABC transporter ATP-binding protein [Coriobacteriales bacterium]
MTLFTCKNASFAYEGHVVVSGLDFTVERGDYLCIVGENGSGKSTLIKGLLKLLAPKEGSVELGEGLKPAEIGYLPQLTPVQKDFPASVFEVVVSGRLGSRGLLPFYTQADKALAEQQLALLGMEKLKRCCYRELSGGQQQRVLLARALTAMSEALLLDEPVSGLDPLVTQELYRVVSEINRERGVTIVMVSHDIRSAVHYASHILHLQNTQVFFGTSADYLQSPVGIDFLGGA